MKYLMILPVLFALAFTAPVKVDTLGVDVQSSKIGWKGYKVTGSHTGFVSLKAGTLTFADGKLTAGSFEIDMNSIACTDLQGGMADKLVGHLKSDDFFGVAKFPTAKFVTTSVISRGTPGSYKVLGNLTIKDTTKPIKFNVDLKEEGNKVTATATLTVDRAEYDVRYGSGSFFEGLADKTIYDEFDLNIELVATK